MFATNLNLSYHIDTPSSPPHPHLYLGLAAAGLEVFGQDGGVGVRIVSPDHDKPVQVEFLSHLLGGLHLFLGLDLVPPRSEHVETTRVPDEIKSSTDHHVKMVMVPKLYIYTWYDTIKKYVHCR